MKLINFVIFSRIIVRMDDWFLIFMCCPHGISTIYRNEAQNYARNFKNIFLDIKNAEYTKNTYQALTILSIRYVSVISSVIVTQKHSWNSQLLMFYLKIPQLHPKKHFRFKKNSSIRGIARAGFFGKHLHLHLPISYPTPEFSPGAGF